MHAVGSRPRDVQITVKEFVNPDVYHQTDSMTILRHGDVKILFMKTEFINSVTRQSPWRNLLNLFSDANASDKSD